MTKSLTYRAKKDSILTILILNHFRRIEDQLKTIKFVLKSWMSEIPISVITWYLALASALFLSDLFLYLIYELYE